MRASYRRAVRIAVAVLISALLLVPCFWQQRIQAGDLSSHIYNAWLAQLIERGQAPGLTIARQSNNVLFDLMLSWLMRAYGAAAAQRIAVSIAVLVFFWGAFGFVWAYARRGRAPWELTPCLAMLAYGWVFRMGLFNFYLSLGLAFGALALARLKKGWAMAAAVALLPVAYAAHAMPVAWAIGIFAYGWVAERLRPRRRVALMIGTVVAIALAAVLLAAFFPTRRGVDQYIAMTGADQFWIYGRYYIAIVVAILAVWALCFRGLLERRGTERTFFDARFQICALNAAALALLPGGVLLPGCRAALDFIAERMSLAGAVLFCALVASSRIRKPVVVAMAAIAVVFFSLSYVDERALNHVETEMEQAVAQLPPGQRVVSMLADPESRVQALTHFADRVCVGRCFSYANYEPSTAAFRVRAYSENPFVVSDYGESWSIQTGGYVVKPRDLPLYNIDLCKSSAQQICIVPLRVGATLHNRGVDLHGPLGEDQTL
ncbi:MAG TPA: hypothetical protein VMT86_00150 [Bryobacteraceae bacterium]|nr:hypothetical protein [Bryobacteraceae bacterium]